MGTHLHGYSSAQRELSNGYQHSKVKFFEDLCVLVLWTKVASALEGIIFSPFVNWDDSSLSIGRDNILPICKLVSGWLTETNLCCPSIPIFDNAKT